MQEAFQPDMCQALYDGDTNKESSVKRSVKAVNRTLRRGGLLRRGILSLDTHQKTFFL
jgi:hypothetical protein